MDNEQSTRTVNITARGGSLLSGRDTVTIDQPHGMQLPEVTMSGDFSRQPTFNSVNIKSSGANVSLAKKTAVLINLQYPKEAQSRTTDNVLSTDQSSLPSPVNVTGGTSSGDTNLHFFVHEQGKYIQIGQCCVIVEMHVNDQTMERLKAQGTLEVVSQIDASLVTMRWIGNEVDEAELRTNIKVQLTSSLPEELVDLERTVLQDLVANQCDKCQQLVTFLMRKFRGYLSNISLGCIQLTLFFSNREDFQRGRSSEALAKIQKFLDGLLLTDRVNEGFRVTVLEEDDEVASLMDTTFFSRDLGNAAFDENLAGTVLYEEPGNLASGQSGEIMRQDQVMHRISLPSTIMTCSGKFSDVSYNVPVFKEVLIPIKPSEGKELYTNKSHGGSGKQCLELSISSRSSEGSYQMECSENLTEDEEVCEIMSPVEAIGKKSYQEVMVKQRSQPLDFSHLFNAIHGRRTEMRMEKLEVCLEPEITELHEYLKEILGEDSMRVVQQASEIANKVTRPLDDVEISEKFCTVLCVDLSHSMAGQPIKDQATLATKIIQDCLGHIGLVSIGSETKVEQELTKDKDTALNVIGQLQIDPYGHGSSSPVLQGLFTALKLLQGRVKPTDYGSHHTMYPKIVIISDGFFNDCFPDLEGKQPCQKTNKLLTSVLEVLVAMDIKMPIYFVPVGKKQDLTCGWFSKLSVVEDVEVLSDSEVREMFIGRAMNAIMWPSEPEAPYDSWQAVKKKFAMNHSTAMLEQIEWFITEHFKHAPPIGTRVKIDELKTHRTGTVFCHIQGGKGNQTEEVLIVHDTGYIYKFIWSFDQEDILLYKPFKASYTPGFPVGTLVRKGGERSYGDLGVVISSQHATHHFKMPKTEDSVSLEVCWRSKLSFGDCCQLHYNYELTPAESPLLDLTGLIDIKTSVYNSPSASKSVGKMKEQKKMKSLPKGLKGYKISQAKAYQGREERVHSPHCS